MFLPDNIDLAQSEKYRLSIRLTPNGFSFLIFMSTDTSIYYYKESSFSNNMSAIDNIKKIFFESNLFNHPFKKISVSVVSPRYTIVPDNLFDEKLVTDLFNFNIHGGNDKVLYNHVEGTDFNIVFDIDEEIYSFMFRNLWNPNFVNFTSYLIPYFISYGETNRKRCFVVFHDNMISINCFESTSLTSSNTIIINDQDDIVYHIANIWDKYPLDQNNDYLYFCGEIEKNRESIKTFKQLIRNVDEIELPINHSNNKDNSNIPIDLLVQLCE